MMPEWMLWAAERIPSRDALRAVNIATSVFVLLPLLWLVHLNRICGRRPYTMLISTAYTGFGVTIALILLTRFIPSAAMFGPLLEVIGKLWMALVFTSVGLRMVEESHRDE